MRERGGSGDVHEARVTHTTDGEIKKDARHLRGCEGRGQAGGGGAGGAPGGTTCVRF